MEETAMIACNMVYKLVGGLKAGKIGFYTANPKVQENATIDESNNTNIINGNINGNINTANLEKEYCSVIKKVKKDNITPDNIGEIMLCQIPGISSASALAILSEFKTLPNLIKSIHENDTCLNAICTTDANGKSRKISKTAIATIIKFLKV